MDASRASSWGPSLFFFRRPALSPASAKLQDSQSPYLLFQHCGLFYFCPPPAPPSERLAAHAMLGRLAPRRRALSSVTRALRPLRVGGVPEHFNTPWHTAIAAGRFDELGLQVDR